MEGGRTRVLVFKWERKVMESRRERDLAKCEIGSKKRESFIESGILNRLDSVLSNEALIGLTVNSAN
jgi:hypothetical protein